MFSVFQTRPYLMAYRRHFGAGKQWHRLQTEGASAYLMSRGRTARRLEWWGAGIADIGGCKYLQDENSRDLWRGIENLARRHDAAELAQVHHQSALIEHARDSGWRVEEAETCPVLALPASFDEYVRGLGKNMREQIKRYPKRLAKEFEVEITLAHSESEIETALDDLFRLHGARWRARGQTGVLATPRRQKFHREVCREFGRRDWLRLWTLKCDGRAACVLLNYFHGGRYWFFIGGFEPELMRWSVGTCLFSHVIRHAIEEGATEFDFLRGREDYKYRLGATDCAYYNLSWFSPRPRGKYLQRRIALEKRALHLVHERFSAAHRKPKESPKNSKS